MTRSPKPPAAPKKGPPQPLWRNLQHEMARLGLSDYELAVECGQEPTAIRDIGRKPIQRPSLTKLRAVAKRCGRTVIELRTADPLTPFPTNAPRDDSPVESADHDRHRVVIGLMDLLQPDDRKRVVEFITSLIAARG